MKSLLTLAAVIFLTSTGFAAETSSTSFSRNALSAKSRNEALIATSDFYALPKADMSNLEIGGYVQSLTNDNSYYSMANKKQNNSVFYFKHSRGINNVFALDFNLDYMVKESSSSYGSTGINRVQLGGRTNFTLMDMTWVSGAGFVYTPESRYPGDGRELAVYANLGFEEAVDIALWGLQFEMSTESTIYTENQFNLLGFFEMPFVTNFNVGLGAGTDLSSISEYQQKNYAKIYGKYNFDRVSAVQAFAKQTNQKSYESKSTQNEVGVALNRVF